MNPTFLIRGNTVKAEYRKQQVTEYNSNPLIESLPDVLTTDNAMERLMHMPGYDENDRKLPVHIRRHKLQSLVRFFMPLNIHIELEQRFSRLIRYGYIERNPMRAGYWNDVGSSINALESYADNLISHYSTYAAGFNLIGISGIGKTQAVIRSLLLYPQVIIHSEYKERLLSHKQLVWLKLECPFDGGIKGLCMNFFQAVDSILGTQYRRYYGNSKNNTDAMLSDIALVAANHFLGVLVIDEIQRLNSAKSGGAQRMLDFFVQLVNTVGVPVVLVGTYNALSVLSGNFSQLRRGTGQGDVIWDRMKNDSEWRLFVESLWSFQYTRKESRLEKEPELLDVLYEETQGITDLVVKAFIFAQDRAIESGKEKIAASIIRSAARDKFNMLRPALDALKTNDKRALARYEDIYPATLKEYLRNELEMPQVEGRSASVPDVQAVLINMPGAKSGQPVSGAQTEAPAPSAEASRTVSDRTKQKRARAARTPQDRSNSAQQSELPRLIRELKDDGEDAAYEALKAAGYIRSGCEFLSSQGSY